MAGLSLLEDAPLRAAFLALMSKKLAMAKRLTGYDGSKCRCWGMPFVTPMLGLMAISTMLAIIT